jgi:hypothetical protein
MPVRFLVNVLRPQTPIYLLVDRGVSLCAPFPPLAANFKSPTGIFGLAGRSQPDLLTLVPSAATGRKAPRFHPQ